MGLRDEDIAKESFPSGTKVRLTCNVGYRPAGGSPSITCTAGSWSSVTLRCESEYQLFMANTFKTSTQMERSCKIFLPVWVQPL